MSHALTSSCESRLSGQSSVREEERDLARGVLEAVGAVHDILLDARRQVRADRARRGLLRIGGAHELAVLRDGVVALEHLHHDRTRDHEADQVLEERPLAVHGVEALGLRLRQLQHAGGDDARPACSKRR